MKSIGSNLVAAAMALTLSTTAWAGKDCPAGDHKLGENAVRAKVEGMGYKVKRIKREHGCYEVEAQNKAGQTVELKVSAADGILSEEEDD